MVHPVEIGLSEKGWCHMAINDPNKWTDHVRRENFKFLVETCEEICKDLRREKIKLMIGKPAPLLKRKIDMQVQVKPEPSFKELLDRRGK